MDSRLFVANEKLMKGGMLELVEYRKNRPPRIVEEGFNPLLLQTFNENL